MTYRNAAQIYDLVYAERRADVNFYLDRVAHLLQGLGDAHVLEVGVGTGRTIIPMAQAHPNTFFTGIDVDENALEVLTENSRTRGIRNIDVQVADVTEMIVENPCDVVIAPFRVLQHCLTSEDIRAAVHRMGSALYPGGALIFDLLNPSIHMLSRTGLLSEGKITGPDGASVRRRVFIRERSYFDQTQRVEEVYLIHDQNGEKQTVVLEYETRYFFRGEIEPLLREADLRLEHLYGDFEGTPFGQGRYPGDLVFVATKNRPGRPGRA